MSIIFLLFFPILVGIFSEREKNYKWSKKWILFFVSSMISCIISLILIKYISSFDIYRGFVFGMLVATLEYYCVIPIIRREKISYVNILNIICLFSITATIYYILTYGQATIDSDIAMPSFLDQTIWKTKSLFPTNWAYVNGDIWVISIHLFVLPFTILLKNQSLARMLGASLLFMFSLAGIYYQDKKIFKNNSWLLSIPLFLIFLQGKETLRFMRSDNLYTIYMLFITIILTQITLIYKKKKKILSFALFNFILTITGLRMLSYFTLPLILTFFYLFYSQVEDEENFKIVKNRIPKFIKLFLIILIPALLGSLIHIWLRKNHIVDGLYSNVSKLTFVSNTEEIRKNFILYFEFLFQSFGFTGNTELITLTGIQNLISIVSCFFIIFYIPILQLKKLKNEKDEVVIFYIFGIFHSLIIFIVMVFLGRIGLVSYVLTTVYICILISSRYIKTYWLKKKNFKSTIFILFFSIFSIIQITSTFLSTKSWKYKLTIQKEFTKKLVNKGLNKGYSTYWNAYNNNLYSDYRLKIAAVNIDIDKNDIINITSFKWLTDIKLFELEKNKKTFLLLTKEENEEIKGKLDLLFGKPIDKFTLFNTYRYPDEQNGLEEMYVYVFDHDIIADFPNGLNDKKLFPKELRWNKENVSFKNNELLIKPNGYTFGPYSTLASGKYILHIYGTNLDKASIDIFSQESNEKFQYNIINKSSSEVTISLNIKENVSQIEFRIFNYTKNDIIKLNYMTID